MKNKIFYATLCVTASYLFGGYATYGSDRGRSSLPESQQKIIKEAEESYEGAGKRVQKRWEARDLQKQGKQFGKDVKSAIKPLEVAGTGIGAVASASGDPHAKAAAGALNLSISAVKGLGYAISKIIMGIGRYQERSQEILSNAEVLLEEIQKSLDKKEVLEKKLNNLLKVEKLPQPSESSSRLKQLGKGATNLAKVAEIKTRQATDFLTNDKADREEKIKAIQEELKVATEDYNDNIRLLQILLMQDALNETEKLIDIEGTIASLESNVTFYEDARKDLSKSKSKRKKELAKIEKDEAINNKDLIYYIKFQKFPTKTHQELATASSELTKDIKKYTELSKRGDSLYLQEKEIKLDSQVNRAVIVGLYKEMDSIKSQLEALSKTIPTKDAPGAAPKQPVEVTKSQREPLLKTSPTQATTAGDPILRDNLVKQRENLRPVRRPSSETPK